MADRGADRSCLARGVPDLDQGGRNGLRASAAPRRPSRPSPPPPPLSKEALAGSVPLRTFGQLKQLWEARVDPTPERVRPPAARRAGPQLKLASHRGRAVRGSQFRPEILPIRDRPTRSPRRPRNPIRGTERDDSKLPVDRKDHSGTRARSRRATVTDFPGVGRLIWSILAGGRGQRQRAVPERAIVVT